MKWHFKWQLCQLMRKSSYVSQVVFIIVLLLVETSVVADEIIPHHAILPVWERVEYRVADYKELQAIHKEIGRTLEGIKGGSWFLYNASRIGNALKHGDNLYYMVDVYIGLKKSSLSQRNFLPLLTVLVPVGNISGTPFVYKKGENLLIPYSDWVSNEFPGYMSMNWKAYVENNWANAVNKIPDSR